MSVPKTCSRSELANLLGITTQGVGKATDAGVLKRLGRGEYDLAASVQAYIKYRESVVRERCSPGEFNEARIRKMKADAQMSEITLAEKAGKLVNAQNALHIFTTAVANIKARVLALPNRCAPRLADKSASEVHEILRREMHGLLRAVAQFVAGGADNLHKGTEPLEQENIEEATV
jgi:phage terminase Nu1 subunit (DNA packaging protein)